MAQFGRLRRLKSIAIKKNRDQGGVVVEFLSFMFFSIIESVCLMALVMSIYRFKLSECPWHVVFTAVIMSLQSYYLREELSLSFLAPILCVVLVTLLLTIILKVPIQWALFVTAVGYFGYVLIQLLIIVLTFGINEVSDHPYKGYIVQALSSLVAYLLSRFLYNRGYGFSFEFEKKRLKYERGIINYLIPMLVLVLGYFLYEKDLLVIFFLLVVALIFFLYFSIMKERNAKVRNNP